MALSFLLNVRFGKFLSKRPCCLFRLTVPLTDQMARFPRKQGVFIPFPIAPILRSVIENDFACPFIRAWSFRPMRDVFHGIAMRIHPACIFKRRADICLSHDYSPSSLSSALRMVLYFSMASADMLAKIHSSSLPFP
jgi:hypothetical protein